MQKQLTLTRRAALAGAGAGLVPLRRARAQSQVIRIGFLSDLSGPYRDNGGVTSIACAQQAVQDLGLAERGIKVEIISADHQNKPDVGLSIARQWFDRDLSEQRQRHIHADGLLERQLHAVSCLGGFQQRRFPRPSGRRQ